MSKTERQIERQIMQLDYISCRKTQHEGQDLSMVCKNMQCQGNRLLCCYCLQNNHQQHNVTALKDYLLAIYDSRRIEFSNQIQQQNNQANETDDKIRQQLQTNYLSFIFHIENHKLSALKSIDCIRQKFLNQLTDIEAEIKINTNKYIQKVRVISQINFGNLDLLEKVNKFTKQKSINKLSSLIDLYLNNFNISNSKENTQQQINNLNAKNQKNQSQTHQQLLKIQQTFKSKIKQFQLNLNKFDLKFIPQLSKLIAYQNIKFKSLSSEYEWDPLLKSINFQIDTTNNKIIRAITNTAGQERFAFMKKVFPVQSKTKFMWAMSIKNLAGWISVGVGLRKVIQSAKLKFNYSNTGHGSYMISANGYSWSHSSAQNNSKKLSFSFSTGDTIVIELYPNERKLTFTKKANKGPQENYTLLIAPFTDFDQLSPCINMCSPKDQIQIIPLLP